MKLVARLALKDLARDWLHLVCNVAVIAGVIVPLLVLFGVKNGVYEALIGRLLANPATLQIDTSGNNEFTEADVEEIRAWPQTGFATLKTRSLFDYVNVRAKGRGPVREAVLTPSGEGDPTLPPGLAFGPDDIAVSETLAGQLDLAEGQEVQLITQASERPRQLVLTATIRAVIPADRMSGRTVLADISKLDLIEAFYDQYALPDHGITDGRPLADRVPSFEGMRIFARRIEELKALQERIEARFAIRTEARTREVEAVLGLGRNLDLALLLTASVAALGLAATLIFGFWSEVARKRRMIASLALLGIPARRIAAFPVIQAVVTAVIGLVVSFLLLGIAAQVAAMLFDSGLAAGGLVRITGAEAALISLGVMGFVGLSAAAAARRASVIDPAIVLRETG